MSANVINLADYKNSKKTSIMAKENSTSKCVNKYKEALKKMTREEYLAMEELLEN